MSTVTITKIFRKDVETKYGIKAKVGIQTNEYGEKWLSTFKTGGTESWKEGDTVDVEVSEKGEFLNFNPKGGTTVAPSNTTNVNARLDKLEKAVFGQPEAKEATIQTEVEDGDEESF